MAWEVPITVDGKTYTARFEGDTEPTPSQIEYAKRTILDPARGQSTLEGVAASTEQGFQKGLTQTFVTGPGAVAEAIGFPDNPMLQAGKEIEKGIEEDTPVSLDNQKKFVVKAGGAIGQGASMLVTSPLAGAAGQSFRAASLFNKARQIALMGGFAGAAAGEAEATRLGVTDPWKRSALILGYGATEAGSELLGGYAAETAVPNAVKAMMRGGTPPRVPHLATAFAGEAGEEIGAGVSQRYLSQAAAVENPENAGFTYEGQPIYNPWDLGEIIEEGTLGGIAGSTLVGASRVFNSLNPQQQNDAENVSTLPQQLRKKAWDALQKVSADEQQANGVAKSVDENTAAAMRVAFDGKRANVIDEAKAETNKEFAPGWEQREKMPLQHAGEDHDSFYEKGQWMVVSGTDKNGQPIFAPAPNAKQLEADRQEFIKTGELGEGMQPIAVPQTEQPTAPASATPPAAAVEPSIAPAPPVPPTYREQERARVQQAYPSSPELVSGIDAANGDAGVKAFLEKAEPKAKVIEEVSKLTPEQLEEKMRSEGVDEAAITRSTRSGQTDPRSAANAIIRARENAPKPTGEPIHVKEAKEKMAQLPPETVETVKRGASQALSPTQISKTYEIPEEDVQTVFTALRVPKARREGSSEVTEEYIGWLATPGNFPEQAKKIRAEQKAAKRKKEGPRVARATTPLDSVMRSKDFKAMTAGDFISNLLEKSGSEGFAGPKLIQKREGGKIAGLTIDPDQKGEWDWYKPLLENPELRAFVDQNFLTGGQTLDDASNAMDKMRSDELGEQFLAAATARFELAKQLASGQSVFPTEQEETSTEEKQTVAWEKATGKGAEEVTGADLRPGDTLNVQGEPVKVRGTVLEYDETTGKAKVETADGIEPMRLDRAKVGDVILDDGSRFGRQLLGTGETIWVENHERSGTAPEEAEEDTAPLPQTSRQQAAEFEGRMREHIEYDDIEGITNADIEAAVQQHMTGEPQEMSEAAAALMARVQSEMRSPAELRASAAEQGREGAAEIEQAKEENQSEKATTPAMLEWANGVVAEGNVNAGLNPRLLAAHSVRAAYWIMQNGNHFAKWSAQMVKTYGKGIQEHLAAIWNLARATMYGEGEVRGPEDEDVSPAPERRISPLTQEIVTGRGKINAYGEGLWEEGQAVQAEMRERGDNSVQFSRTAEPYDNVPELVEGQPAARLDDGTIVIVTDQVHVTLEDVRNARKNETAPTEEAIARVIREQRRSAGEENIREHARRVARQVLADIQSAPQMGVLTDALWQSDAFMELDAIAGQRDNLTPAERAEAVRIWIDDHFAEQVASVLSGDSGLQESMLPPGASNASRRIEQLIKDALTYPYLLPKARIRFSARSNMQQLQDKFAVADELAKQTRTDDAARIRAINGEQLLSRITNDAAREWAIHKLEQYARLVETGQINGRHLTKSFTRDYLPIYARSAQRGEEAYEEALHIVRNAVREITGDSVEKYGYHDSSREPSDPRRAREILREDTDAAIKERAEAQARTLQSEPGAEGTASPAVARASAQGTPQNRGVSRGDVQSAINGLRGTLPNVDSTWVGTRNELQGYLRHNPKFKAAWVADWTARNGAAGNITPDAAFDDFINFGLEGMEALTFDGRTYLMTDQIDVKPERGGNAQLSARWVLIHENTHEVADHILDRFPELKEQWHALRNRVNPAQLDKLAETRWTWMRDWRNNSELHDRLVHEWMAERIAEIEDRGKPPADSLLGKLMQWLRDVISAAMGQARTLSTSDRALLDFIEAARTSYQQALTAAANKGVRYSATDGDGNTTPANATAQVGEGPQTPVHIAPPPKKQSYNRWSQKRRSEYESAQSNPNLPGDMFHFMQFLGQETNHERITQSLAPMLEMSNRRLGGVDGTFPDVTQENTDAAYRDARALHERKTFSRKYIREFQQYYGTNEEGLLIHEGDAAVAVHQMNLMRYAVRLMAETGDTKLFTQMEPFANDVILSDFTTMSGAARLLNARSFASRSDVGIWTAIQLTSGARHQAAASEVGEEARDTVAHSIASQDVKDAIQLGMDTAAETDDAAAELEQNATEYETEGYRARAVELLDEQARAWDAELDRTLRRLDELQQLQDRLTAKAASAVRPSMQEDEVKFEGDPAALAAEIERLKAKAKGLLQKLTQDDTSHESKAQRRQRTKGYKRAVKALSADEQAKALLERYENRNKRTKRDKPAWKDIFDIQVKTPGTKADFMAAVQGKGVTPEVAERLYELADTLNTERVNRFADQATKTAKTKGKKGVNASAFLNSVTRQILKTPLSQQRTKTPASVDKEGDSEVENGSAIANPWNRDWVKQTFVSALIEQGLSPESADQMAEKLSKRFDDIMRRAQEKAATTAARGLGMKEPTIQKIGHAIRSGAFDTTNANPVIAALAEAAGYKGLTNQDLQRLAQLDDIMQTSVPTLVAKAITEVSRILAKASPRKKRSRVIEQLFINGALSSLGVASLNWLHPAYTLPRILATDLAGLLRDAVFTPGKAGRAANLSLMADTFTSLWQARRGMLSDAYFSLKNDAYQTRMLEHLSQEHSLYREMMESVEKLKTGNAAQKLTAGTKLLWLSSDWVRRILSSADQTWGGAIQQFVLRNEAMRQMVQNLGMAPEAAHGVLEFAISEGEAAEKKHAEAGNDKTEAALVGRDVMRESLRRGISELSGSDRAGEQLMETAEKTAHMELGNRRGEDSPWWDLPNTLLESFKSAASAVRNKMDAMNVPFGRAFTGFVSVASNIMNRSMYFTPLGFARVWAKSHGSEAKMKRIYTETMATKSMERARLNEAIVSSIALSILAILKYRDKDDDDYMTITGSGPSNNQQREAWLKQGHKPGMIEFRDGKGNVMAAIPYTRGGFDHLAPALTTIGALDDMDLNGHRVRPKDFNWGWAYAQQMAGNQIKQAQFFGVRELVGAVPSSDKPHALAGWVGYTVNPWTPWGGLTKSVFKIFSGQQEQGSARAAFLSNVPVAQLMVAGATGEFVGPRLNFLGDQIGGQPEDTLKKMAERASYAGFPIYIALDPDSKDEDIYNFIVRKGVAPAMPIRSDMETKNGFLDDEQWAHYIQTRGQLLKDAIRRNMGRIERAAPADAQSMMETISRDATRQAKAKLKLN